MKVRVNYVSNSSSSSCLVPSSLTEDGIACVRLSNDIAEHIKSNADIEDLETLKSFSELWVTRPITEYESPIIKELISNTPKVHYLDHQMDGTPYDDGFVFGYDVGGDLVYLQLSHVKGNVMSRDAFIRLLKEKYDKEQLFIANFSDSGITLDIDRKCYYAQCPDEC